MSFSEIVEEVEKLSFAERSELRQRLNLLELAEGPSHRAEVERRFVAMKAGRFHGAEELRERLSSKERYEWR